MSQDINIWLYNNPYAKKSEAKPHADAILQQLLQNTLNTSQPIKIFKNSNGKPYLKEPVYFSHSNSQNLYAYVISTDSEVAIDVERIKPHRDVMKLVERYFHADEWRKLQQLSDQQRIAQFYQWWTKKEAWCKLEGGKLWSYLSRPVDPNQPIKTEQGAVVNMTSISEIEGFAGTLASTATIKHLWINSIALPCAK